MEPKIWKPSKPAANAFFLLTKPVFSIKHHENLKVADDLLFLWEQQAHLKVIDAKGITLKIIRLITLGKHAVKRKVNAFKVRPKEKKSKV